MDKQSKMLLLVKKWKMSGLSREVFSRQHGITYRSFEYWCRKLNNVEKSFSNENQPARTQMAAPSFIEFVDNSVATQANRPAQIELELPGGLRVKIY